MLIKQMETEEEINGKAYVHWQAWKEAYTGLLDQAFLDGRSLEMSQQSAHKAFQKGAATFIAKVLLTA